MLFLGTVGTIAVIYLLYILARLSERLGSVERMSPLYRYYYGAIFFLVVALIAQNLAAQESSGWFTAPWFLLIAHHIPMAIGTTAGLWISWRYWSWLIITQNKE